MEKERIESESIIEFVEALSNDKRSETFVQDGEVVTRSYNTLRLYGSRLRLAREKSGVDLLSLEAIDVNEMMDEIADEYAPSTVTQYQSALKLFYEYHDGHAVGPDEIPVDASRTDSTVDEREVLRQDEIERTRELIEHPRNRAMFDMFAETAQRIRVLQTLRLKDVDCDKGVFWINEEVDGRKDAEGKRPLLDARESVREWIEQHPTGNPDDYLFTPLESSRGETGTQMRQQTFRYHFKKLAEKAGIDPDRMNPHAFRHYWTTRAVNSGLDDQHIKAIRGDSKSSRIFEEVYSHLSDDDAVSHAEERW